MDEASTEQPTQPKSAEEPKTEAKPPWGDDFDAPRAWETIQKLRGIEKSLSIELSQAVADREELETLRNERLSADEKALKEATDRAAQEAQAAAEAAWRPKYQTAQLSAVAAQVITDKDQLKSFMAVTDPGKFAGDDGEIDEGKVMGHLTAIFGARQQAGAPRNWGQISAGNGDPTSRPGDAGKAEAAKRFGTKS